jgi:hypothetical protein
MITRIPSKKMLLQARVNPTFTEECSRLKVSRTDEEHPSLCSTQSGNTLRCSDHSMQGG